MSEDISTPERIEALPVSADSGVSTNQQDQTRLEPADTEGPLRSAESDAERIQHLATVEWLDLSSNAIQEKQTKVMARELELGRLKNLKALFLHNNTGDIGVRAMLNVLQTDKVKELEILIAWNVSSYDQITNMEEGTDAIEAALKKGNVPKLHTLDLESSLPKLIAPRTWSKVLKDLFRYRSLGAGRLHKLVCICCGRCFGGDDAYGHENRMIQILQCHSCKMNIYSGNDGIRKIVRGLTTEPLEALRFLNLRGNYIGDKGLDALACLLELGKLSKLEEVDLQNNPVTKVGARRIIQAFLRNPLLTVRVKLDWPTQLLKERASAVRDSNIRLEHRVQELRMSSDITEEQKKGLQTLSEFKWKPAISMKTSSRFFLHCQNPAHDEVNSSKPEGSQITDCQNSEHDKVNFTEPEGIQIKRRSWFGHGKSSKKFVDRDKQGLYQEVSPDKGVTRIHLKSWSCGFEVAVRNFDGPAENACSDGLCGLRSMCGKFYGGDAQIYIITIIEELLVLADRKPIEFNNMFGLWRVLVLKKDSFSPACMCEKCSEVMGTIPVVPIDERAQLKS